MWRHGNCLCVCVCVCVREREREGEGERERNGVQNDTFLTTLCCWCHHSGGCFGWGATGVWAHGWHRCGPCWVSFLQDSRGIWMLRSEAQERNWGRERFGYFQPVWALKLHFGWGGWGHKSSVWSIERPKLQRGGWWFSLVVILFRAWKCRCLCEVKQSE